MWTFLLLPQGGSKWSWKWNWKVFFVSEWFKAIYFLLLTVGGATRKNVSDLISLTESGDTDLIPLQRAILSRRPSYLSFLFWVILSARSEEIKRRTASFFKCRVLHFLEGLTFHVVTVLHRCHQLLCTIRLSFYGPCELFNDQAL